MFQPSTRSRIVAGARRLARAALVVGAVVISLALVLIAAWLFIAQPLPDDAPLDALIGIAGIVATVLSLYLAAMLLVAQHIAERHARVLYQEFRRERAWLGVLAALGTSVVLIAAAALAHSTMSTAWAALALSVALGALAGSLLPRLLSSLDPIGLATRVMDRRVDELRAIARRGDRLTRDQALRPVARHGLELASVIADQGITTNDAQVVRASFAGMRRVLVAFVESSTTRGWDGEIVDLAFQHLGVATDRLTGQSPVLILPTAIEELILLGVESQATLERNGNENVSIRLNSIFVRVVATTLTSEQSAGAAMATRGIGESGLALIRADSPNGVADHIRQLRRIALGALAAEQDHVAGTAHVAFSRLAVGLASLPPDEVMPPNLYADIAEAIAESADAYLARATRGLIVDIAWLWVTGPHMEHNLSHAIVAGIAADARPEQRRFHGDFVRGAKVLINALVRLSADPAPGSLIQSYAAETAYLGVIGALALDVEVRPPELIAELWATVVHRLLDPTTELSDEVEMLSALLLFGTYEAELSRPTAAAMRGAVEEALRVQRAIGDHFDRRRRARAWVAAGRAALGSGDEALADAIAATIAVEVLELRELEEEAPWRVIDDEDWRSPLFTLGQAFYARPEIPDVHRRPDIIEAFDTLLDRHAHPGDPEEDG